MTLTDILHGKHNHHAATKEEALPHPPRTGTGDTTNTEVIDGVRRGSTMSTTASKDLVPLESGDIAVTLEERLRAWKHLVGNLEEFIEAHEQLYKATANQYEKVYKTIADPLKQSEMFTQQTGGVQSFFDNLRTNTQALANSNTEVCKTLKSGISPNIARLHAEIKSKSKELSSSATKGTKSVAKSREATKKHVEQLATLAGQFDSEGGKNSKLNDPADDPYILKRGVLHRLHKQVQDENTNRQDLLAVQNGFQSFETHIIQTVQYIMNEFYQVIGGQTEKTKALYGDIVGASNLLPVDFEWNGFLQRYGHILIDPSKPNREVSSINFPNMDHSSTKPLIEGSIQRKGKVLGRYNTAYYVVTPSKYLHEFANNDNFNKDPDPELSLYLPDCKIGALTPAPNAKFTLSGKDANKHQKLTREHEFVFKCASHEEGVRWWEIISHACGVRTTETPGSSPLPSRENTLQSTTAAAENGEKRDLTVNTNQGNTVTGQNTVASPVASPVTTTPVIAK